MQYEECIAFLYRQLPMYQNQGKAAYKPGLDRIQKLCSFLGNPQHTFKSIHIAGTNGKGSCAHMLTSILQEAGYSTGLYTSPHLVDFTERVKLNGIPIGEDKVIDFVQKIIPLINRIEPSFFEITVALAFYCFAEEKVDIAIIETGLGGRLDSTNIIHPELCLITNIGWDHMDVLGSTLEQIALEKAGIIKKDVPLIIGEEQAHLKLILKNYAQNVNAPVYETDNLPTISYTSDLKGWYQVKNIKSVYACIQVLKAKGWKINEAHIQSGFANTVKNTGFMGRWQLIQKKPKVVCDTAHNLPGIIEVLHQIKKEPFSTLHLVWGMVSDKDISSILQILPKEGTYYFCKPSVMRGKNADDLLKEAQKHNLIGHVYPSVYAAYLAALKVAQKDDFIYIGGSTFVVADFLTENG